MVCTTQERPFCNSSMTMNRYYLKTEDGKKALDDNFGCFDWGDVYDIPDSFFAGYGLLKVATPEIDAVVNHDESLVDGN